MTMPLRASRSTRSGESHRRRRALTKPLLTAIGLSLLGFLAVGLSGARPVAAADPTPTPTPFVEGRHVYGSGDVLSSHSAANAESLAAHIQTQGGGRVAIYTATSSSSMPRTLAKDWNLDGLLITANGNSGSLTIGSTLKGKLSAGQFKLIDGNSSPGPQTTESWVLSTLARVDAFVSGTHIFDGAGVFDANGKQQAETAAVNLGNQLGITVYVDIAIGGTDPSTDAFFNGADVSNAFDEKTLAITLAISGHTIGGYLDSSSDVWGTYDQGSPWSSNSIENWSAPNSDNQAAILAVINAIQKPPLIPMDAIPWIIFAVATVVFAVSAPFLWGPWLIRKLSGVSGPIKGGVPSDAVIESIADTGVTVTMPSVGPDAPDYKFTLQVTPIGGGAPYQVVTKALVPRLFIPMVVPGARIGVLIDPADPQKVSIDFSRINEEPMGGGYIEASAPGGFNMAFDASGQPAPNDIATLVSGIRSGAVNQIKGSAAHLLATGTHGTAVITTAMPLGKTVRDINPAAEGSYLNDPMWLFTVEVSLAGQTPFPAVFGHRVPVDKLASVAPGVKLAVAVDEANKNQGVAIDWDKSPVAG
jgi:hypothetical protein